jgi:hypothetical protein
MAAKKNRMLQIILILIFIFILIVLISAFGPFETEPEDEVSFEFPQSLGNLTLIENYTGEQAYNEIKTMHLGDFDFIEGYVAGYWGIPGGNAKVWVSLFHTESESEDITEQMTQAISKGNTPFSIPEKITVNNTEFTVYSSVGLGAEHFYWFNDRLVIWIALEELNEAETNEILIEAINELIIID